MATITYSFLESVPDYYFGREDYPDGFSPFNSEQRLYTYLALAYWHSVANIDFVYQESGGEITFGNKNNFVLDGALGEAYPPSGNPVGRDVWISNMIPGNSNPIPGSEGFWVLLHEIGHALGLAVEDHVPDNFFHSVMNAGGGVYPFTPSWYPERPMVLDSNRPATDTFNLRGRHGTVMAFLTEKGHEAGGAASQSWAVAGGSRGLARERPDAH